MSSEQTDARMVADFMEHLDPLHRERATDIGKGKTLDDLTVEDFDRVTALRRRGER